MAPRPTLKSVAAAAGVSTAQVSYAFNRPDRLSAQARRHILAVAREQGYAGPDATARSLRTGRAGAIGVIFTVDLSYAFTDPYVLAMLGGLAEVTGPSSTQRWRTVWATTIPRCACSPTAGSRSCGRPRPPPGAACSSTTTAPAARSAVIWPTSGTAT